MRLSVIGSGSYENVAVNVTARSFGLESFTDPGFNLSILLSTMWAMTICILYEPLLVLFGTKTLDKGMTKIREKKPMVYTLLIDGVFIALMGWFCAPYLTSWVENRSGLLSLVAMVTAMVAAFIFAFLGKKTQKSIFNELSFPGGMLVGMLGAFITNLIVF
ncbi:MAG: DUF5058 family protein [Tissierellia bacterium]|nr:DUF5058 family protein [Tissierellia bacterium]